MKEDESRAMPEEPHGGEERPARQLKLTEKGRSYVLKEAELDRNKLGKRIRRLFESVKTLMESEENQDKVEEKLRLISSLNHELKEKQDILLEAERSQEECERHLKWDCENKEYYDESKEVVEGWLEQVSKSKGSRKEDTKPEEEGDEIEPGDSISNVSSQRSGRKSGSLASSVSRASARLREKAELAALSIEADAMKKKHEMARRQDEMARQQDEMARQQHEMARQQDETKRQQEEMARCQEQLELDTKLKVAKARRDILESEGSRCSSRSSKAISSRQRAKTAQSELAVESIPRSKSTGYLGLENLNRLSEPSAQQMGARPKLATIRTSVQTREGPVDQGEGSQVGILALLHKQSEFNEIIARRNKSLILPPVEIPTYAGDPLEYETFVRALEEVLEKKVEDEEERLRFLVKYTQGKVKGLVESCQMEPGNQGYKKARRLLKERFGDEQRIANAYIERAHDWREIKPEDVDKLSEYAIFLRRCCSSMKNLGYMEEINLSSNMRIIISKLPRRMREKWRDRAGEIRDKSKQVARLPDLVEYLEREVRYMSDSCSGIIEEAKPLAIYKGSTYVKTKQKTGPNKSNFATNIIPEKVLGGAKEDAPTRKNEFCPFCDEVGHTIRWCRKFKEKKYEKKMDFLKRNGICYGCLKKGHMVKDCKCPIVCDKCKQNHPDVLHTVKKEPDLTEQKKESADVNAITSPQ
ncbi:golgin subfamily A member 6-like protein 7, partial [Leucoraja erinacea]|uniref:golgin subfamily A member 6-like protein 7 n=1 Tax=Leucoraja erinaceus TaxID=7782 RepID=UPI002458F743